LFIYHGLIVPRKQFELCPNLGDGVI